MRLGGGLLAAGLAGGNSAAATLEIAMRGNSDGSKVWFDPVGLLVRPGQSVTWINRDPGNAHTATAFHPENDGHPLRMPSAAKPWNSDYLLPDGTFTVAFTDIGIYDYFCIPHEMAGMVARILVLGEGSDLPPQALAPLADIAEDAFPAVDEILASGSVFRS
jgi:plastocyanin